VSESDAAARDVDGPRNQEVSGPVGKDDTAKQPPEAQQPEGQDVDGERDGQKDVAEGDAAIAQAVAAVRQEYDDLKRDYDDRLAAALEAAQRSAAQGPIQEQAEKQLDQLAQIDTGEVQAIAASQLRLLTTFYAEVLGQARKSFTWAVIAGAVGVLGFVVAVLLLAFTDAPDKAAFLSAIAGAIVEVISALSLTLYGRATDQLRGFHARLEQTQRFLLANSICEAISDKETRWRTRADLVRMIAAYGEDEQDELPVVDE
jgi:hypothetical protein